jgi:hypothetical protein
VKVEVSFAHYLVENKTAWHCTHILSSASTLLPLTVLPAKQNQKAAISFFILFYQINKIYDKPSLIIKLYLQLFIAYINSQPPSTDSHSTFDSFQRIARRIPTKTAEISQYMQ